jgi:uncharacterized protein
MILSILFSSSLSFAVERTLNVSGECLHKVAQDRGAVTLVAETLDISASTAANKSTEIYNKFRDKIKKMNLKDAEFETTESSLNEDFDYTQKGRTSKGFRSRQGLRIETSDISKLGEVMKIGTDAGVKNISGIQMFVSAEALKNERESCLEEAFKNAKAKAERLTKASGSKLGPVLEMSEAGTQPRRQPTPMMMSARAEMKTMSDSAPQEIDSRQEHVQVSLAVSFSLQ